MMDIDIDFQDREKALALFKHIRASRLENDKLVKHNSGVYLHEVPVDAPTNLCSIPYKDATDFFKIDFLNVGIYNGIQSEEELIQLMNTEPMWELLEDDIFIKQLYHVADHGDLLRKMKPTSIEQLAAVLALIRPAKRHLVGNDWNYVMQEVWKESGNETGYAFKHSHGIAYATAIVVQVNYLTTKDRRACLLP